MWDGRRRAFIHVGTHKTGTTALQMLLARNAAALASAGFLFPLATRPRHLFKTEIAGHHNLPWQFLGDDRFDPRDGTVEALVTEIRRESLPVVLLSSEDFGLTLERPAGLESLRDALENLGYRTSVITYLRPQRGYAQSLYTELGRQGLPLGFEAFLSDVLRDGVFRVGMYAMEFDYRRLLDGLANVFGADRTIVRPYRPGAPGEVLPRDYLSVVASGLPLRYESLVPVARENAAMSYTDLLYAQFANFSRDGARLTHPARLALERFGRERPRELDALFAPLGPSDHGAIEKRFADANRAVADRFEFVWEKDPPAGDQRVQRAFLEAAIATWTRERAS